MLIGSLSSINWNKILIGLHKENWDVISIFNSNNMILGSKIWYYKDLNLVQCHNIFIVFGVAI